MSTFKYYKNGQWNYVNGAITGDTLPIGSIIPYTSENAPTGWLVCIGQTLSKTTYPELFDIIGYTFGGEEGGDTFNLPNLKGRVLVGRDTSQTEFEDIGQTGGSKYLQAHRHEEIDSNYGGELSSFTTAGTKTVYDLGSLYQENKQKNSTMMTGIAGTGDSGNLQPYQVVCYIIKAKQTAGLVGAVSDSYSTSHTDTYSCEYINEAVLDNYSSDEQVVGTWFNGKAIYRKVIDFGALPNNTSKSVAHNVSNIDFITNIKILSKNSTYGFYISIPYTNKSNVNYQIEFYIDDTSINITTGDNKSGYDETYVILEYTKSTD